MSCVRNDVVLLPFPFSDLASHKVRPAVVIGTNSQNDLFLVPVTSQGSNIDLPLVDWRLSGLNVPCGIKAQLATIEERLILKVLGRLTARDRQNLDGRLRNWLKL
jgi:mRNA interferase MazF